ncbi:hypothetical protein F5984_22470 [Rudanella paleaurantiibacter]|uniref:HTH LytTR-type domain-containing protein n=1 Tax=Rudanella paleaurantiibacter TaxID=2614655 RepID=A0A7J5TU12_9BACT|nr:LytTR family DNA-binding domain-containing protein [Rudanella paleaurantiibacter]KAB7727388.1 hypothetical protein F5984_22470 [Rudanella paleaurantiibacter]
MLLSPKPSLAQSALIEEAWPPHTFLQSTMWLVCYYIVITLYFLNVEERLNWHDTNWLARFACQICSIPLSLISIRSCAFRIWKWIWPEPVRLPYSELDQIKLKCLQLGVVVSLYLLVTLLLYTINKAFGVPHEPLLPVYVAIGFIIPTIAFYWYNEYAFNQYQLAYFGVKADVEETHSNAFSEASDLNRSIQFSAYSDSPYTAQQGHQTVKTSLVLPDSEFVKLHENNRVILRLLPDQLYMVRSQGNYVFIHWLESEYKLERTLIRTSISDIEDTLKPYPMFMRTHRSFIINLEKVSKVEGNARGLFVHVSKLDETGQVSRRRIEEFRQYMAAY